MLPPIRSKDARAYILLPGIRTQTGDNNNWAPQMASDINILCDSAKADEFRYFTHALFHKVGIDGRAGFVVDLAHRYWVAGYEPVLVGHSDGCEIIRRAILAGPAIFKAAHLFAAACDADFQANGFNDALLKGKVDRLHLYVSKGDGVLDKFARNSRRFFSWLGIAYGTLGFDGPQNPSVANVERITVDTRQSFTHGAWFEGANWDQTRRAITRLESQ